MDAKQRAELTRWVENREAFRDVRGRPSDGIEPENEADHFYRCESCGQPVDMRSLYQVLHHEQAKHDPLPVSA